MEVTSLINAYMEKYGVADPAANTEVKHSCVNYIGDELRSMPDDAMGPNEKESFMGDVCSYLELFEEAVKFYDAALKINPQDQNTIISKLQTLVIGKDTAQAVEYAKTTLESDLGGVADEFHVRIKYLYLWALSANNQINSLNYVETLNELLNDRPDDINTHIHAASLHQVNKEAAKYLHHVAKIVELTREDEEKNSSYGYNDDVVGHVVFATNLAIKFRDKYKTWLFIGHLMNSNHDNKVVLNLRNQAFKIFPPKERN